VERGERKKEKKRREKTPFAVLPYFRREKKRKRGKDKCPVNSGEKEEEKKERRYTRFALLIILNFYHREGNKKKGREMNIPYNKKKTHKKNERVPGRGERVGVSDPQTVKWKGERGKETERGSARRVREVIKKKKGGRNGFIEFALNVYFILHPKDLGEKKREKKGGPDPGDVQRRKKKRKRRNCVSHSPITMPRTMRRKGEKREATAGYRNRRKKKGGGGRGERRACNNPPLPSLG